MIATINTRPRIAVLTAVLLCSYAIAMEATVVSAAIPTIIGSFGGLSDLSWVFSAYLIAQAVTMPLFGSASDRIGRKRSYAAAAMLFFAGTLACGFAWDMLSLILFRVLQGIGAGGLITIGTAALNDIIPNELRGKYQAMISTVWGLAAISAPAIGTVIMELLDWRYIFWINLPIIVISALLLCVFYEAPTKADRDVGDNAGSVSVLPTLYLSAVLLAVMVVLVHGQILSWPQWIACAAIGGVAGLLLWHSQQHGPAPLFPAELLRMRVVLLAVSSAFLCGAIAMGLTVYVPSFAALVLHANYLTISSTVAVMSLTWTFSGLFVGLLMKSQHYRPLANTAGVVMLAGALGLGWIARHSSDTLLVLAMSGILGIGLGAYSVIFSVTLQSAVSDSVRGSATSLFYLARMIGQAIGVALCGGVLAGADPVARALMSQSVTSDTGVTTRAMTEAAAGLAGSMRDEFFLVFVLIAGLALVQLLFTIYTPGHAWTKPSRA